MLEIIWEYRMKLSIITTLYNSRDYVNEFYQRISLEAQKITEYYEIIFVDDGSPDDSLCLVVDLTEKDERVRVVELSRNFGHHNAVMEGLSHAKGEFVFLIDCDLEEKPETLGSFWNHMHSDHSLDVVYGVQKARKGGVFERISGKLFWDVFNILSDIKVKPNQTTARLMSRRYIKSALDSIQEKELFLAANLQLIGYNQAPLAIDKSGKSSTTYTMSKKLALLINSITGTSSKPLIFIFYLGCLITLLSTAYMIFLLSGKLFYGYVLEGWTSIVVSIWFLGGVIIFSVGVIGIYLAKIFNEVKNRPRTIVKRLFNDGK